MSDTSVGLFLTGQFDEHAPLTPELDGQFDMLRAARDGGWDSVWTGQHFLPAGVKELQPVPLLSRIIPESGSMFLGMGVHLLSIQNPIAAAEDAASLHALSGGRLIYGAALGYRDVELDAFGVRREEAPGRLTENLRIVRALFGGTRVDADLPWCRLREAEVPLLRDLPPIPIWVGANADPGVKRAAALADAWFINPHARLDTVDRQLQLFKATRRELGRPPSAVIPAMKEVVCAPTRSEAVDIARTFLGDKYRQYLEWGQQHTMPHDDDLTVSYDDLASRFIVGDPADCIDQLRPWQRLGVDHIVFRPHWPKLPAQLAVRTIELLSAAVLPRLRAAS